MANPARGPTNLRDDLLAVVMEVAKAREMCYVYVVVDCVS